MSPGARVAAFVALLAVIFAGAAFAGAALDPSADGGHRAIGASAGHGHAAAHDMAAGSQPGGAAPAAGVASAQDGVRLVVARTRFVAGRPASLRFRIVDGAGATVREFETEQARRMHLVVVRRDLRRYQHLHPRQGPDGAWVTRLTLPDAGVYRAFADFRSAGAQHVLGIDLFVAGNFAPLDLPRPAPTAGVDGYEARLQARAGETSFVVRRGGRIVGDLQPYLGARGHLVVLREGDLAYQHVHPTAGSAAQIAFHTGAQQPGTYRLFLQFRHAGRVHTAAFTRVVAP
jgi:hypothetical protein